MEAEAPVGRIQRIDGHIPQESHPEHLSRADIGEEDGLEQLENLCLCWERGWGWKGMQERGEECGGWRGNGVQTRYKEDIFLH